MHHRAIVPHRIDAQALAFSRRADLHGCAERALAQADVLRGAAGYRTRANEVVTETRDSKSWSISKLLKSGR